MGEIDGILDRRLSADEGFPHGCVGHNSFVHHHVREVCWPTALGGWVACEDCDVVVVAGNGPELGEAWLEHQRDVRGAVAVHVRAPEPEKALFTCSGCDGEYTADGMRYGLCHRCEKIARYIVHQAGWLSHPQEEIVTMEQAMLVYAGWDEDDRALMRQAREQGL